jgi:hypothetical protein
MRNIRILLLALVSTVGAATAATVLARSAHADPEPCTHGKLYNGFIDGNGNVICSGAGTNCCVIT